MKLSVEGWIGDLLSEDVPLLKLLRDNPDNVIHGSPPPSGATLPCVTFLASPSGESDINRCGKVSMATLNYDIRVTTVDQDTELTQPIWNRLFQLLNGASGEDAAWKWNVSFSEPIMTPETLGSVRYYYHGASWRFLVRPKQ